MEQFAPSEAVARLIQEFPVFCTIKVSLACSVGRIISQLKHIHMKLLSY